MSRLNRLSNCKGFSLLEVIVVVAFIAILFALGVPSFMQGRVNAAAREEARELLADLDAAKNYAIAGGGTSKLQWNSPKNNSSGYKILDTDGNVRKTKTFNQKVFADFSEWAGNSIEFYSNGSSSHNGSFYVKVKGAEDKKHFKLSITKSTGLVSFSEVN